MEKKFIQKIYEKSIKKTFTVQFDVNNDNKIQKYLVFLLLYFMLMRKNLIYSLLKIKHEI